MAYMDDLKYQALLLVAASRGDEQVGARAYEAAWDSQVDPIHIAQLLARMVGSVVPAEKIDEELVVAAAAAAVSEPEPADPVFLSPRGKIRKPRRGAGHVPPKPANGSD